MNRISTVFAVGALFVLGGACLVFAQAPGQAPGGARRLRCR